ncbi:small-conductance mechanosensitive channel MscS [Burkholderia ubonensis]|uniref:small-conductance mechanosensitive channel MscS n=1 Tax=Burkholderia ubonensis TaxID=101571 RepID=UPI00075816BC|nr:small-conductance mechanosensitive channel MscS [Burkholderia ubonensis]KWB79392.1 mechanosensitive ion channel protein MscS [Burkholderia ubonensis]
MTEKIFDAGGWLIRNQTLFTQYAINIIAAISILIIGVMASRAAALMLNRVMYARGIDETVSHFLATLMRYGILAFAAIAALSRIGVQTTSVIAILGAAGLAVGLALQGSLSNFAAGVLIVAFRPLRAGEYVAIGNAVGTVDAVQIFSTTLRTGDNKTIVIPNSKIIADNIINYSRAPLRRVDITVGVAYSADIDVVKRVLGDVIGADRRVLHDHGVTVRLNEMAASSLNFVTRAWTSNTDYWDVYFDLMENFKRALDAHHIGIPFPQMDVHLHPVNAVAQADLL